MWDVSDVAENIEKMQGFEVGDAGNDEKLSRQLIWQILQQFRWDTNERGHS